MHAVRRDPAFVDLGHPVVGLAPARGWGSSCRASGTAASRSTRSPCRDGCGGRSRRSAGSGRAGRSRMAAARSTSLRQLRQAPGLGDFAGAGAVVARPQPLISSTRERRGRVLPALSGLPAGGRGWRATRPTGRSRGRRSRARPSRARRLAALPGRRPRRSSSRSIASSLPSVEGRVRRSDWKNTAGIRRARSGGRRLTLADLGRHGNPSWKTAVVLILYRRRQAVSNGATAAGRPTTRDESTRAPASLVQEGLIDTVVRHADESARKPRSTLARCGEETRCAEVYKEATQRRLPPGCRLHREAQDQEQTPGLRQRAKHSASSLWRCGTAGRRGDHGGIPQCLCRDERPCSLLNALTTIARARSMSQLAGRASGLMERGEPVQSHEARIAAPRYDTIMLPYQRARVCEVVFRAPR